MVLLIFVVAGGLAGFACGGRMSGFSQPLPRGLWLCIASFLVQGLAAWVPVQALAQLAPLAVWQVGVAVVRYGLLLVFAVLNIRGAWAPAHSEAHGAAVRWDRRLQKAWPCVFGAGTAANAAVILANGGAMPVAGQLLARLSPALAASLSAGGVFGYTLENTATRLSWLGDIIYIGFGPVRIGFASIGDLLIGIGAGLLVFCQLRAGAPAQGGKRPANA